MSVPELQAGDRVVVLASLIRGSALVAGAASGGITAWLATHRIGTTALYVVGGTIIGYIVGLLASRLASPVAQGTVVVIRVGWGSLPRTLGGGLCASIPASAAVSLLCAVALGADMLQGLWPSLGAGIALGIAFALLSSLT
ncbi:MAG: hypothetical protein HN742_16465 [Lentisphaerae bacterium]|jgi:hypothetical protein|nr:hypothetical protein [Lentisphaerota bacterium]MBT4820222.1 hypothetical protein [Lentisphaerota bacterium]MBT5612217.1 hypothetical protein [Lentisphaerota bacterium]MBT7061144.1 hypothetical protein [Lentisphaerota bacterium]MBT7843473.1 hypothetical protein [Lentisphaerota bacterium]